MVTVALTAVHSTPLAVFLNLSVVCCVVVFHSRECNCISVTRVTAASRSAVSSVMSGNARDGVAAVVGGIPLQFKKSHLLSSRRSSTVKSLFKGDPSREKPESRGCNLWCHPGEPPGSTIKMRLNLMFFLLLYLSHKMYVFAEEMFQRTVTVTYSNFSNWFSMDSRTGHRFFIVSDCVKCSHINPAILEILYRNGVIETSSLVAAAHRI